MQTIEVNGEKGYFITEKEKDAFDRQTIFINKMRNFALNATIEDGDEI